MVRFFFGSALGFFTAVVLGAGILPIALGTLLSIKSRRRRFVGAVSIS